MARFKCSLVLQTTISTQIQRLVIAVFAAPVLKTVGALRRAVPLQETLGILLMMLNGTGSALALADEERMLRSRTPTGSAKTRLAHIASVALIQAFVRNRLRRRGLLGATLFTFVQSHRGAVEATEIFETSFARRGSVPLILTARLRRLDDLRATPHTFLQRLRRMHPATVVPETTRARRGSIALFRAYDGSGSCQSRLKLLCGGSEAKADENAREEADDSLGVDIHISLHYTMPQLPCRSSFCAAESRIYGRIRT